MAMKASTCKTKTLSRIESEHFFDLYDMRLALQFFRLSPMLSITNAIAMPLINTLQRGNGLRRFTSRLEDFLQPPRMNPLVAGQLRVESRTEHVPLPDSDNIAILAQVLCSRRLVP